MPEFKLITVDPGHFHAALVQKEMYPGVDPEVHVYGPVEADLVAHLNRIARFNARAADPTRWKLEVHASPDFYDRLLAERPGNIAIFSGRNRGKIDRILACVEAGLNVLADKPWIIRPEDFPTLAAALDAANHKGLIAYDIMTERFEITSILQRQIVQSPEVFGQMLPGSAQDPAVYMESVHHIMKWVAGAPNLRPAWFFDVTQQGEAIADVGTHLVDMVQWTLYPEQAIDYRTDVELVAGERWATVHTLDEFRQVTGETDFPPYLSESIHDGKLHYFCNSRLSYALRGVHVKLNVLWNYEAPAGAGDTHLAIYRGSRASVEIRQGAEEHYRPELFVVPNAGAADVASALRAKIDGLQNRYPGLSIEDRGDRLLVVIPERYRVGHEAHFGQVASRFLGYLRNPSLLPAWEQPNMLAKYYVCTKGMALSHG